MNKPLDLLSILAIDTSQAACSVAIFKQGELFDKFEILGNTHTDFVLSMVDSVLHEAKISLPELDALAFGRGPGSFTGLRIAAALIQGLSLGANLPVLPVSTLAALAYRAKLEQGQTQVCAILDARMHEVYWGCYEFDVNDLPVLINDESLGKEQDIVLPSLPSPQVWYKIKDYPRAREIALIAAKEFSLGRTGQVAKEGLSLPTYIRNLEYRK